MIERQLTVAFAALGIVLAFGVVTGLIDVPDYLQPYVPTLL